MKKKKEYSLIGVDGNAFSVMGYVQDAMEESGFTEEEINSYIKESTSSDYKHLLAVSASWIHKCNNK